MFHPASAYLGLPGSTAHPPADAFQRLAAFGARLLSTPAAFLSLVEAEHPFAAGEGGDRWAARRSAPLRRSLCRHPVESGLPLLIEDARDHPLVLEDPSAWMGEIGYAGFPIRGPEGTVAGCFSAVDERPRTWSPEDVEVLTHLASLAGLLVEAASARGEAAAAEPRRPRGVSGRMLQKAVETMQIGVTITDPEGRILYSNPADARMHGYRQEELVGHDVRIFAPAAAGQPIDPERIGAVTSWSRESVNIRRDGSTFPVLLRSDVVHDGGGRPLGLVTSCEDLTHRKGLERELLRSAFYHPATGLPNRDLLLHRLNIAVDHARRDGPGFAVLAVALDRYQMIHDSLGRPAADALLVEAGRRLDDCMGPGGMVAHLSAGEFAVLLEGIRGAAEPVRVAACVHTAFAAPFELEGNEVFTGVAVGIALGTAACAGAEDVVRDAGVALVRARDCGGPYAVFDAAMHDEVRERLKLEGELRRALERGELRVHYQPIVRLETGRIAAFESLVRWAHPTRGLLMPDSFIPLAEDTGLLIPLGRQVLHEACRTAAAWRRGCAGEAPAIAVNLSARQFADPAIVDVVEEALRETGLDPAALELEITESVVMQHTATVAETLRRLKALGVRLNVDDFGTGYSSLAYLHRLPVDALKIDRSFVQGGWSGGLQIVRTIVALAHALEVAVICEGVETPEVLGQVRGLGCEFAQGYHFAEPVAAEEARALVSTAPHW
jgi:PAS domain S-box-containing protein/diguanylate cyclase (GGDEF)-like protein